MKRSPWLVPVFCILATVCGCGRPADVDADKIALLRIHLTDLAAYRANDVTALMETIPGEFIQVREGRVVARSRDGFRDHLARGLDGVRYEKYDDLQVPHAEVSDDGTMGWVISRLAITLTEPDDSGGRRTRSFIRASLVTYRKIDGRWMKIADVSTFAR